MSKVFAVVFDIFLKLLANLLTVFCLILFPFWQAVALGIAGDSVGSLIVVGLWVPLFYAAFSIHELGHLAAGLLMKLQPQELVLGLFRLYKGPSKWEVGFNRNWNRAPALVRFQLPLDSHLRTRFGVMLIGGPLINLVWTALCLALAAYFYQFPPFGNIVTHLKGFQPGSTIGQFLWVPCNRFTAVCNEAAWLSFFYGVAPLLPGLGLTMKTDGLQLWELWRHGRIGNLMILKSWPAHLGPMPTTPGVFPFPQPPDGAPPGPAQ